MVARLAVLMAADLVDYSRMMEEDEEAALGAIGELKDKHFEPVALKHGGEILKRMGDGWIVAFSSIAAAVQSAMEVQTKLAGHRVIGLRIGAHIGEIVFDDTDFYGAGVNLAQRLQTEAPPGGLMISQDLYRQLSAELAKSFTDAGSFKLKNIALPVNGYQWRPPRRGIAEARDVPLIAVESFPAAPDETDTRAAADDLRDQLILRLSRRTGVRVVDKTAGPAEDPDYLLRGRLRVTQARGRFNLALIMKGEGRPLWSQTYEGDTSDIFQFCDDLIERADADLRVQINAFDAERIADLRDEELSVSELQSRAASSFYKATMESWDYALELLNRALRLSPEDPMALAMRSEATVTLAAARYEELPDDQLKSLEADLNKAVELSPRSDYVFWARGQFRVYAQPDYAGARKDVERALTLSPAFAPGYELQGLVHLLGGDFEQAVRSFEKAVSLSESDPLLPYRLFLQTVALVCAGRAQAAADSIERAIQLRPNEWGFQRLQALCYQRAGNGTTAKEAQTRAARLAKKPSILAPRMPVPQQHADLINALCPA